MNLAGRLVAIAACFMCVAVLSAQDVDRAVSRSISEYFKKYNSPRTKMKFSALDRRRNNIVVNNSAKDVIIYSNEAFAGQAFTQGVVDTIYNDLRKLLPRKLRDYGIKVVYAGRSIDERVPNVYREKDDVDNERLWGKLDYKGQPWVLNASRPYAVTKGLQNRHLALWQSHGLYYNAEKSIWKWQRPPLYCTTEDLFTQSFVIPLLLRVRGTGSASALSWTTTRTALVPVIPRRRQKALSGHCAKTDTLRRIAYMSTRTIRSLWVPQGR